MWVNSKEKTVIENLSAVDVDLDDSRRFIVRRSKSSIQTIIDHLDIRDCITLEDHNGLVIELRRVQ